MLGAQIGSDDLLVLLHLLRRPRGDQLAVVKDVHCVGYVHDQVYVVLHQQHGHAGIADHGYLSDQFFPLALVGPRGGLVEEE